jgi:hypothetical protein
MSRPMTPQDQPQAATLCAHCGEPSNGRRFCCNACWDAHSPEPPRPSVEDAVQEALRSGCDCKHPMEWHGRHGCYAVGCLCANVGALNQPSPEPQAQPPVCCGKGPSADCSGCDEPPAPTLRALIERLRGLKFQVNDTRLWNSSAHARRDFARIADEIGQCADQLEALLTETDGPAPQKP